MWGALVCSGCATIEVPDLEICSTLTGDVGGFCRTTIHHIETEIPNPYWSTCEPENPDLPCVKKLLHISPEDVGEMLKFIEKSCDRWQNCVTEEVQKIKRFFTEMTRMMRE